MCSEGYIISIIDSSIVFNISIQLDGGFKSVLFSSLLGEMIQFG